MPSQPSARGGTTATPVEQYAGGLEVGGREHGKPGVRTDYGPSYYAAFPLDPDGNNVEAVCLR